MAGAQVLGETSICSFELQVKGHSYLLYFSASSKCDGPTSGRFSYCGVLRFQLQLFQLVSMRPP